MIENVQLLSLKQGCEEATARAVSLLSGSGLRIIRSFDLQSARSAHVECACPHHGTAECTCQFVVLLVYGHTGAPVTLVAHGQDGFTWFSLVDTPRQPADSRLRAKITQALLPDNFYATDEPAATVM